MVERRFDDMRRYADVAPAVERVRESAAKQQPALARAKHIQIARTPALRGKDVERRFGQDEDQLALVLAALLWQRPRPGGEIQCAPNSNSKRRTLQKLRQLF